jgi:hypothetical protein
MAEINYRIEMQGLTENIIALERFAPDLKRQLNKEIRGILAPIVLEAKSYLPSNGEIHPSGWQKGGFKRFNGIGPLSQDQTRGFIAYDAERAKSGIKQTAATTKKDGTGFRNTYGVIQRDPGGAIFETAGRGSSASRSRSKTSRSRNPQASQHFIGVIQREHGVLPTARGEGKDKGRALIRAVDRNRFKALNAIREAVDKASAKAQSRVDSVISQREV